MEKTDIKSMTFDELGSALKALSLPAYRTQQIYSWLHQKGAASFSEMSNLPVSLRERLAECFALYSCTIENKRISQTDGTVKYLFKLHDGECIESVLMKYKYGYSLCVSSQAGCRMGCSFCASTVHGLSRNLTASEILSQVYTAQKDAGIRVSHVVLMGMGEPLDNFEQVMRFLFLVTDEKGINLSMRNISLSTCGLVPGIYALMEKKLPLTLSVSLHAPNDELRSRIMPVNKKYNIAELIKACRIYAQTTSRRISFEYSMINGVNDTDACARELAGLLKGMLCHINLIPVNAVRENHYVRSTKQSIEKFSSILESYGLTVTVRRSLGGDIEASCGQLRNKHLSHCKEVKA